MELTSGRLRLASNQFQRMGIGGKSKTSSDAFVLVKLQLRIRFHHAMRAGAIRAVTFETYQAKFSRMCIKAPSASLRPLMSELWSMLLPHGDASVRLDFGRAGQSVKPIRFLRVVHFLQADRFLIYRTKNQPIRCWFLGYTERACYRC